MNCQKDDVAVIVRSPPGGSFLCGRIVTCRRYDRNNDPRMPEAWRDGWFCEGRFAELWAIGARHALPEESATYAWLPDALLKPLRYTDGADETLREWEITT